jgi:hypothetical protein
MGRSTDAPGYSVMSASPQLQQSLAEERESPRLDGVDDQATSAVRPFIVGTIVGGVAGALLGTALSSHTRGFVVGLFQMVQRRLATTDYDRLRFELLLQ